MQQLHNNATWSPFSSFNPQDRTAVHFPLNISTVGAKKSKQRRVNAAQVCLDQQKKTNLNQVFVEKSKPKSGICSEPKDRLSLASEVLLVADDLLLLLDLVEIEVGDLGLVAVDNFGQLLESRSLGLDVHEVDEAQLPEDPALGLGLGFDGYIISVENANILQCRSGIASMCG